MAAPIEEPEQRLDQEPAPHLSHSRINRYLTCPEQYRLYYVEKLRPRIESASLVFGVVIHAAIADLFRTGEDPVEHFARGWQNLKHSKSRFAFWSRPRSRASSGTSPSEARVTWPNTSTKFGWFRMTLPLQNSTSGPASTAPGATFCRCALGTRRPPKTRW